MVKVTAPCLSLEASGSLGKAITYQKGLKSRTVRKCPHKKYTRTTAQALVRDVIKKTIWVYKQLIISQKSLWSAYTDDDGNTGYQSFTHLFATLTNQYIADGWPVIATGQTLVGERTVGQAVVLSRYDSNHYMEYFVPPIPEACLVGENATADFFVGGPDSTGYIYQYKLPPNLGFCIVGENKCYELVTAGSYIDP